VTRGFLELRPYQDEAVDFLVDHPKAGLFIDMGLGKTAIILNALLELEGPTLLVGPIRVIETVWRQEALLWPGTKRLTFSLLRGTPAERTKAAAAEADVYLVNPELLPEALLLRSYNNLVLDESTLFKNPSTKRFKELRKHLGKFKRVIATGTPTPNGLLDLWSQVFILDQGERLGRAFGRFKEDYFYPTDYQGYKWAPKPEAREAILGKIHDLIFRVPATALAARQVFHNPVSIILPPPALKQYKSMEKEAFARLADGEVLTAAFAASVMMKLRQMASGFVYDDDGQVVEVHTSKIDATRTILEETGSPVIIVYQFRHELAALQKAFPSGQVYSAEIQDDWNAGKVSPLFLHPQTGGHGLNLQYGGHTMVIFSSSFSLEQMSQTMGRIDRQGQTSHVVFHHLVAQETVDELLQQVLGERAENQSEVLRLIKEYADAKNNRP